jgi:hypothetical protein
MKTTNLEQSKALDAALKAAGIKVPDTEMVWPLNGYSHLGSCWIAEEPVEPVLRRFRSSEGAVNVIAPDLNWLLDLAKKLYRESTAETYTFAMEGLEKLLQIVWNLDDNRCERLCEAIIAVLKEREG